MSPGTQALGQRLRKLSLFVKLEWEWECGGGAHFLIIGEKSKSDTQRGGKGLRLDVGPELGGERAQGVEARQRAQNYSAVVSIY